MAITYGFFNSVNGDRTYNADQMSKYFSGLIGTGVFQNFGNGFQVTAGTGLTVNVQSGRAVIGSALKWFESDSIESLALNSAHSVLNRYSAIVIQLDNNARTISLAVKDGANATDPVKPAITANELCLAYIYVSAGATSITQSSIIDSRSDSTVCGWITGLINQVDTTTLFEQWQAAYNESIAEMENWEIEQKAAFEAWLSTLTEQLEIGAYIKEYKKSVTLYSSTSRTINLDMTGYSYDNSDVIFVYINGLLGIQNTDWSLSASGSSITVNCSSVTGITDDIEIKILKSVLGVSA